MRQMAEMAEESGEEEDDGINRYSEYEGRGPAGAGAGGKPIFGGVGMGINLNDILAVSSLS